VLLEIGPLGVVVSRSVMDVRRVLMRVWIISLVVAVFIHTMLAGGLAVTLHSIVTVSSSLGLSLSPLIDKLVRGTVKNN
jgi:hypothetical protein